MIISTERAVNGEWTLSEHSQNCLFLILVDCYHVITTDLS